MRPCCSQATAAATRCTMRSSGAYSSAPELVSDHDVIARSEIERRRQFAPHVEERREYLRGSAGRILRRVSCMRESSRAKPQSQARTAPHAPVIQDAHGPQGDARSMAAIGQQEHERRVGRLARRQRDEHATSSTTVSRHAKPSCCGDDARAGRPPVTGNSSEQHAADRQPHETGALQPARIVGVGERRLSRLSEEYHAVELHHDVGGERRGQRDYRRTERQQHVDERSAGLRALNRKACSSSHSDTKPLSGGSRRWRVRRPARATPPTASGE